MKKPDFRPAAVLAMPEKKELVDAIDKAKEAWMDERKKEKLIEIGYVIQECCGLCRHSNFHGIATEFALCFKYKYPHSKHTEERHLGVHRSGLCFDYEESPELIDMLGGYRDYMEEQ